MLMSLYRLADFARYHGRKRSWDPDLATGRRGEDIAHRHLEREGLTVVARNHRTSSGSGEVDLIAWHGETLVFVEVKTRTSAAYGPPERAISPEKWHRFLRAATDYARQANIPWERVRFDTVGVLLESPPRVEHHADVFSVASGATL